MISFVYSMVLLYYEIFIFPILLLNKESFMYDYNVVIGSFWNSLLSTAADYISDAIKNCMVISKKDHLWVFTYISIYAYVEITFQTIFFLFVDINTLVNNSN